VSPFSAPVLACAAVLASPALYQAFVIDTMPPDVAVVRYLVVLAVCWAAISAAVELVRLTGRGDSSGEEGAGD
jgi:hypothetical protein